MEDNAKLKAEVKYLTDLINGYEQSKRYSSSKWLRKTNRHYSQSTSIFKKSRFSNEVYERPQNIYFQNTFEKNKSKYFFKPKSSTVTTSMKDGINFPQNCMINVTKNLKSESERKSLLNDKSDINHITTNNPMLPSSSSNTLKANSNQKLVTNMQSNKKIECQKDTSLKAEKAYCQKQDLDIKLDNEKIPSTSMKSTPTSKKLDNPLFKLTNRLSTVRQFKRPPINKRKTILVSKYKVINKNKYKVVNKNSSLVNKISENYSITPEITPVGIKLKRTVKKRSSSGKRKLVNNKYKIVNKVISGKSKDETLEKGKRILASKYRLVNQNKPPRKTNTATPLAKVSLNITPKRFSPNKSIGSTPRITLLKQKRVLRSKYRVINKFSPQNKYERRYKIVSGYKQLNKKKFTTCKNKILRSRFTFVNKNQSLAIHKPCYTRRIFKNRRTIINKNIKTIHNVATKIKNKYHFVNKQHRNSSWNKWHSSGGTLKPRFSKGPYGTTNIYERKRYSYRAVQFKGISPSSKTANRVLNRSINRVLKASSKKKINTYCMFYNRFGRCNRATKCPYIHDPSKIAVCTRFLRGTCKQDNCPFSHEMSPGKMALCSYFLLGSCNKENCPYRHENVDPDAGLCTEFVQGYCSKGKECQKVHILMCPKYIQGTCEKGNACAYPHPPQKAKKNSKTAKEEIGNLDMMEEVSRYYESMPKMEENACITVVSRSKNLPKQPAYIPL